ncbi:type IV pilin protein [Thermodesulfobacteriota bacterium]
MKYPGLSSKGFSLVELMIVVVIVGILAAVTVPAYFNHILRSRQADAYHNLLDIKAAQEMYYSLEDNYYSEPSPYKLTSSNTFTKLLSFDYTDNDYYIYFVRSSTFWAEGQHSKLIGNKIRVTPDSDPCIETPGSLKQSLGLENCSP